MDDTISLWVNGERTEARCRPDVTVLEWLRTQSGLRGTKEGCAEGDCGACSVLIGRKDGDVFVHEPANGCILTMGQVAGRSLVTVEGVSIPELHPVQAEMAKNGSSQCGFCTPGFVVALAALQERRANPDDETIHDALAGNLCRCTGYRPIVEAARQAMSARVPLTRRLGLERVEEPFADPASEPIRIDGAFLHRPRSVGELVALRAKFPEATLLAGGTDLNLAVASFRARRVRTILTAHVEDMRSIDEDHATITFGGAVTWQESLPVLEAHYPSFATLVRRFGSPQIRTLGTIAGNLGTASPIGDGAPPLLALGAWLTLTSMRGERRLAVEDFFVDYRKTALAPDEVIRSIHVPKPAPDRAFRVYKVSKRYDQDISTVCGAFSLIRDRGIVTEARIAFGGMAKTPLRCEAAEHALIGQPFDLAAARRAGQLVHDFYRPLSDARGAARYRSLVARNLCERFAHDLVGRRVEVMAS